MYNWNGQLEGPAEHHSPYLAPRMKIYNVSAPPAAAPRRMHEDSSQVGTGRKRRADTPCGGPVPKQNAKAAAAA